MNADRMTELFGENGTAFYPLITEILATGNTATYRMYIAWG